MPYSYIFCNWLNYSDLTHNFKAILHSISIPSKMVGQQTIFRVFAIRAISVNQSIFDDSKLFGVKIPFLSAHFTLPLQFDLLWISPIIKLTKAKLNFVIEELFVRRISRIVCNSFKTDIISFRSRFQSIYLTSDSKGERVAWIS